MNQILDLLTDGALTYAQLRGSRGKESFDAQLRLAEKQGKVVKVVNGHISFKLYEKPAEDPAYDAPIKTLKRPKKIMDEFKRLEPIDMRRECLGCHQTFAITYFPKTGGYYSRLCHKCKYKSTKEYKLRLRKGVARA